MKLAGALAAAEHREFLPLEGMTSAHDAYRRRQLVEMGSVSGVPSTASTTTS